MPERRSDMPWSVPVAVADVPEIGSHLELVADSGVRVAVAELAGLAALPRLGASFDLAPYGRDGLRVIGRVSATVGQTCVVTLEPMENEIEELIDLVFVPQPGASPDVPSGTEIDIGADPGPECLVGGVVDLGALATEFLLLGIDPYPRKPGAVFEAPAVGGGSGGPFAGLAALKEAQRKPRGRED
jgi:Large ribosomal RNA subunit accumulation protein YceD